MVDFAPRNYPIAEIAICLWSMDGERLQEGDITSVRKPQIGIGLKEASRFLWLLIEGPEYIGYAGLKEKVTEPIDPTRLYEDQAYIKYDKRRYSIPLDRLKIVFPALDLARCRDLDDKYQPFYTLDDDNKLWLTDRIPLDTAGLVFDKALGVYL